MNSKKVQNAILIVNNTMSNMLIILINDLLDLAKLETMNFKLNE